MSKKRRKKKKGLGMIVFLSLVILCCLVFIFFLAKGYLTEAVKSKVTEKVAEQVLEKAFESAGDPQAAEKARQIVADMDEEDKKQAEEIIGKYADGETISDCMDIMEGGVNSESIAEVRQYLEQSVSEEDMQALWELYEKYGG
ncbi:MAG: hypothetical protein NC434_08755 [Ruminococcus sp.]|nr:hypothetical protein [Ruminococcus sp.]